MEEKLVSIIVPIYNIEKYIEKCINSIINQTYTNIEIILINDGSTDGCKSICEEYEKKDNRIVLINKINEGLSVARNTGLEKAKGEYVAFIDGDDFVDEKYIETLYNNLQKNNADISACGFYMYHNDKNFSRFEKIEKDKIEVLNPEKALDKIMNYKSAFKQNVWNKLYKKEIFTKNNIKFYKDKIYEDVGISYELISNSNIIVYDTTCLYYYVQREKSITKRLKFDKRELDRIEMANKMCDYISLNYTNLKNKSEYFRSMQYLAVINIMIKNDMYDLKLINETKKLIKINKWNILKYGTSKQKIQTIVYLFNFNLYKYFIINRGK